MKLELCLHYEGYDFNCLEILKHHQDEGTVLKWIYSVLLRANVLAHHQMFRFLLYQKTNTGILECLAMLFLP